VALGSFTRCRHPSAGYERGMADGCRIIHQVSPPFRGLQERYADWLCVQHTLERDGVVEKRVEKRTVIEEGDETDYDKVLYDDVFLAVYNKNVVGRICLITPCETLLSTLSHQSNTAVEINIYSFFSFTATYSAIRLPSNK